MKKIEKIQFFRLWTHFFPIWGCCHKKCIFKNVFNFLIRFFWHQPYLVTTPPTGFLQFKKSLFKDIWEINYFFDFLDVFTPSLQVWWIFVENWWRNNLSKLTTFNPVFQLPHSGMSWDGSGRESVVKKYFLGVKFVLSRI